MRFIGLFPLLLWGAVACREAPHRERPADTSPYGRLEVARVEEEAPPPDPTPRHVSRSVSVPVRPAPTSSPDTKPATTEPPADTARSSEPVGTDTAARPADTAGYTPYPTEAAFDTAGTAPPDTGALPPDTVAPAISPPDLRLRRRSSFPSGFTPKTLRA